jgi:hypothetical protein
MYIQYTGSTVQFSSVLYSTVGTYSVHGLPYSAANTPAGCHSDPTPRLVRLHGMRVLHWALCRTLSLEKRDRSRYQSLAYVVPSRWGIGHNGPSSNHQTKSAGIWRVAGGDRSGASPARPSYDPSFGCNMIDSGRPIQSLSVQSRNITTNREGLYGVPYSATSMYGVQDRK